MTNAGINLLSTLFISDGGGRMQLKAGVSDQFRQCILAVQLHVADVVTDR